MTTINNGIRIDLRICCLRILLRTNCEEGIPRAWGFC